MLPMARSDSLSTPPSFRVVPLSQPPTMSFNEQDKSSALSASFNPSSWSNNLGVAEAIASYRRSQFIITGQSVSSHLTYVPQDDTTGDEANYSAVGPSALPATYESEETHISSRNDDIMSEMGWEEEDTNTPSASGTTSRLPTPAARHGYSHPSSTSARRHADKRSGKIKQSQALSSSPMPGRMSPAPISSTERTPLLLPTVSSSVYPPATPASDGAITSAVEVEEYVSANLSLHEHAGKRTLARRPSAVSTRSEKPIGGRSTFGQTLFNSVAILLGFGMLSEPLAFAYAGWFGGMALIIAYGYVTCYTAKILARFMLEDPGIHTYADIGIKAFGRKSRFITSTLFCLELLAVCVVLVTLYGDSLHSIAPSHSTSTYKLVGLLVLAPTLFMPLSVLSYASMIGILSTLLVIFVLLFDGLTKPEAPGSLWFPAPTSLIPASVGKAGVAFGLFMAGFSGHAVLPSLARDMADPKDCDKMFDWAFAAATVIYALIGGSGYLMFGNNVSDEVSQDLLVTPGYNVPLNRLAMCSLVIMPLTKFAISTRPVNITLEILLGIHPSKIRMQSISATASSHSRRRILVPLLTVIERILFAALAVSISIIIPEFSSMMAFLGSFSAFMLCVIGPVSAKVALSERKGIEAFDAMLLAVGVVMAIWGTVAAFSVRDA